MNNLFLEGSAVGGGSSMILIIAIFVAIFYFMILRPENKKKKEAQQLRDSLNVGDKITTIGGIVGKICDMKDDKMVIETGADRVRIELLKWAVMTNNTAEEARVKAASEARQKAKERKEAKKKK